MVQDQRGGAQGYTRRGGMMVAAAAAVQVGSTSTARAFSKESVDEEVAEAVKEFYGYTKAGKRLAQKAAGMLVFPKVMKAGWGIGGEYGEGALLIGGKTRAYYRIASGSIGFQAGVQMKKEVILFMTSKALKDFRESSGYKVGVDGNITLATLSAGGEIDTDTMNKPIVGFVFSNKGLMYNLTFEGAKISEMDR